MTMNTVAVNQRTNTYAAAEMLAHAQDVQILNLYGDSRSMPSNKADSVTYRRWVPHAVPVDPGTGMPVAIVEGVNPTAQDLLYEDVVAQIVQFGGVTNITDRVSDLAEDDVRSHATQANGEQAGTYAELACWGTLRGGTNVVYSNGTARNSVNTPINANMLSSIERAMRRNKGKEITRVMSGSTNYATVPVPRAFVIFGHTDLKHDFEALPGFNNFETYYSQDGKMSHYEVGRWGSFRIILSPTLTRFDDAGALVAGSGGMLVGATRVHVYPFVAVARDAYMHVRIKGKGAIQPMIVQPDTPSAGDRLGLVGSVGFKMYYTAAIANEAWVFRGECGATAL